MAYPEFQVADTENLALGACGWKSQVELLLLSVEEFCL